MKTKLVVGIRTVEQAKAFLTELYNNHEDYFPETDACSIIVIQYIDGVRVEGPMFTKEEGEQLNSLMRDIYNLPCNVGKQKRNYQFDPHGFLIMLYLKQANNVKK